MSIHHILDRSEDYVENWKRLHVKACRSDIGLVSGDIGVGGEVWNIGPDSADSDKLKISNNLDIATDVALEFDQGTQVISPGAGWSIAGVGGAPDILKGVSFDASATPINQKPSLGDFSQLYSVYYINPDAVGSTVDFNPAPLGLTDEDIYEGYQITVINTGSTHNLDFQNLSLDGGATWTGASILMAPGTITTLVVKPTAGLWIFQKFDNSTISTQTVTSIGSNDLTLNSGTKSVNVTAGEAAPDAILISATNATGGAQLTAGGVTSISSTTSTAPNSVTISSTNGGIVLNPASTKLITVEQGQLYFSSANGGIDSNRVNGTVVGSAVTVNARCGSITDSGVLAGSTTTNITVTNSQVTATSIVIIQCQALAGGVASVTTSVAPSAGSFVLTASNSAVGATAAAPIYHYWIIN